MNANKLIIAAGMACLCLAGSVTASAATLTASDLYVTNNGAFGGNVDIGTANPNHYDIQLWVEKPQADRDTVAFFHHPTNNVYLDLVPSFWDPQSASVRFRSQGGWSGYIGVNGPDSQKIQIGVGEPIVGDGVAMTIQQDGCVGIGTTTPDQLLTVNGDASKPGGGCWNTYSDRRLKDLGAKFNHGLEAIAKIEPVNYHYKSDNELNLPSGQEYVGVVAQEVQKVIPEAVQKTSDGYLTVNNDPIIWTMLNAINQLNQKVDAKDSENAKLKAANEALVSRLEKIEKSLGKNQ